MKLLLILLLFTNIIANEKLFISSSDGLYTFMLKDDKLIQLSNTKSPSKFTVINSTKKYLYSINKTQVDAFKINEDFSLSFLNTCTNLGKTSCHIAVSKNDKAVVIANFRGGSINVVSLNENGSLQEKARTHLHKFKPSLLSDKQQQSHPHNVYISPDKKYCFVADRGIDKIVIYKFNENFEKVSLNNPSYVTIKPASGPRHFTFHPNGKFAYLINELDSTITFLTYNKKNGSLKVQQDISTLDEKWTNSNTCADIHVHPNGKFLYGSNRGHDSIAIFSIDQQTGKLSMIKTQSSKGKTPRNFALSPSGKHLLVANQRSDNVQVFTIDSNTGLLTHKSYIDIKLPTCIKFLEQ